MNNKMPILFIGHGSPMNIIENSTFTKQWVEIAKQFPAPKSIIVMSAHWYTKGTYITNQPKLEQIYDFYGFPEELYQIKYAPPGMSSLADAIAQNISSVEAISSHGLDHGAWCPLLKMYPEALIPTIQISVDGTASFEDMIELGKNISYLRDDGYLILGSGDVVHNLSLTDFSKTDGFPWAYQFDNYIKENVINRNTEDLIHYKKHGTGYQQAFSTPDHYLPLLFAYGASTKEDSLTVFSEGCELGSISMTSYAWGL